jgi:hypothetical protein
MENNYENKIIKIETLTISDIAAVLESKSLASIYQKDVKNTMTS